ncbi:ORF2a [Alphamesonivirus casuarinaense]|uniref:ORF2a n=1 Tax=Alphamesonivirus casuarinaense TaxID=1945562 RepID=M4JUR6_9NIDO|nr:ORF2a [Alphamesonivirus 4]AGE00067.1 ORF2a [Alphamesonivirus 4]
MITSPCRLQFHKIQLKLAPRNKANKTTQTTEQTNPQCHSDAILIETLGTHNNQMLVRVCALNRIEQQAKPELVKHQINPRPTRKQRKQLPQAQITPKPMVSDIKSEKNSMLATIWDGDAMRKQDHQSSSSLNQKWLPELTRFITAVNLRMLTIVSILSGLGSLFKILLLSAMRSLNIQLFQRRKRENTYVNSPMPSTPSYCAHATPSKLQLSLLLLLTLSSVTCLTRIDLSTHHIVSYNKPLIVVDDFLKTTLRYNFGSDLYKSAINYKTSFEQLLNSFRTPYQPLVEAFHVLFGYLGIQPVKHPFNDYLNADSPCPLQTTTMPAGDVTTIGEHFQSILDDGNLQLEPLASYWLRHTEDIFVYTRSQLWAFICPTEYAQANMFLPQYTDAIYNASLAFCKDVIYNTTINSFNGEICDKVNFITPTQSKIRKRRWDSSYVCGWPLVSSAAKVFGGECTTNIDVDSLKSSLTSMQQFSNANSELIQNLQSQLTIVNARTNLHYKQLQQLVTAINSHQERYISDINNLVEQVKNTTNSLESRISINSIISSYTSSLFRVYQTIVDYRFAYIETLNSIQQHYHFPSEHMRSFNSDLINKLKAFGFTIPVIDSNIPYSYGKVNYLNVTGINFYDLEFDIYIPITKLSHVNNDNFYYSTLSALPIGINSTHVTYNNYQGSAICTDLYCLETPINGFCREGGSYWYCGQYYVDTLHKISKLYTSPTEYSAAAMFIPPHTMYFVKNTTYTLNENNIYTALTGSVLMLNCNSTVLVGRNYFNTSDFVECTNLNKNNVFIHNRLNTTDPDFYIGPSEINKLENYYLRDIDPIIKHINNTVKLRIDTSSDEILNQQYATLKDSLETKIKLLASENQRIIATIGNMHAIPSETPMFFYIILGVLLLFVLKLFRII